MASFWWLQRRILQGDRITGALARPARHQGRRISNLERRGSSEQNKTKQNKTN